MTSAIPASPYVGLRPFQEEDFALFFGRDREVRVIASNLQARPLTVLYGASGVGKSSVLQAGVVRRLKQEPGASVLYFRDWQSESLLGEILRKAHELVPTDSTAGTTNMAQELNQPGKVATERAFLLLDQFEEFLLYHANDSLGEEFDSVLSRIVNRKDCPVNVLIGIRDDSLFKLDRRFSIRIPNLLRDTLEVGRLAPQGARSAIEKPLAVFSENAGNGKVYDIEPALVDKILEQVQTGQVAFSESSGIGKRGRQKESQIETAYLQLVLTKLWQEEQARNSVTLRLRTLEELGGADNIVRNHVNSVMNQLASKRERNIAANMFRYLVTPSRSKIAQATKDLVSYAERPEPEVKKVLDALTDRSESRILRRLSDPEQYEIFHDVLAQPLLDWRRAHAEAQATRRLWRLIAGAGVVTILFAILAAYALIERHRANDAAGVTFAQSLRAQAAEKKAQQTLAQLNADDAALAGHEAEAARLRNQAADYAKQAASINQSYQNQQQSLDSSSKQALANVQNANQERDNALQQLTVAQKERDDYKSQLEAAQQQIKELQRSKSSVNSPTQSANPGAAQQKATQNAASEEPNTTFTAPAPPLSAMATVDGGSTRRPTITISGLTLDAGTEICGKLMRQSDPETELAAPKATVFQPYELRGDRIEGKGFITYFNNFVDKHDVRELSFDFQTLVHGASTQSPTSVPIKAVVKSVKGDGVLRVSFNEIGEIVEEDRHALNYLSEVCVVIQKKVSLKSRR